MGNNIRKISRLEVSAILQNFRDYFTALDTSDSGNVMVMSDAELTDILVDEFDCDCEMCISIKTNFKKYQQTRLKKVLEDD